MQVFVNGLSQDSDSEIFGWYPDSNTQISADSHPGMTLLRGVDAKYIDQTTLPAMLKKEWQEGLPAVIDAEAASRTEAVFPAALQTTAMLEMQTGGLDDAQTAEVTRGLAYVSAVRAAAKTLKDKTAINPTDDVNWPTPVDPVQL